MPNTPLDTSIARYGAIAQVLAKVATGMTFSRAIRAVAKIPFRCLDGRELRLSVRTLQRWMAAYQTGGLPALTPASRVSDRPSTVLSDDFLRFLVQTKTEDEEASIPEVIRRAQKLGIADDTVTRVSVWRAARRLNLPIFARKGAGKDDMRRFEYAHRMQMVMADGKHFRAGAKGRKRVVITFLDDASRFALGAVVGTAESADLFLEGIWKIINRWGRMQYLYLDHGSGFIAKDVAVICARLGIGLIHGEAGYPEARGKIERYHRTLTADLVRALRGNPVIDPDRQALTLRIEHYLKNEYNRRGHSSLGGKTSPEERFLADKLDLDPLHDVDKARQLFVVTKRRKVSRDNIVKVKGIPYEMPRGYAGKIVDVSRHMLDKTVAIIHEGRRFELSRVDPVLNAESRRARSTPPPDETTKRPAKTAATLAFEKDHQPIVGDAGDFFDKE